MYTFYVFTNRRGGNKPAFQAILNTPHCVNPLPYGEELIFQVAEPTLEQATYLFEKKMAQHFGVKVRSVAPDPVPSRRDAS